MFTKTKISLAAAIVLSTAFTALAATTPRMSHPHHRSIYNIVRDYDRDRCPASGGPSCSDACLPSGHLAGRHQWLVTSIRAAWRPTAPASSATTSKLLSMPSIT